jgi:hypothetical protein
MRNRFTTRNQWFTETIERIRTSGLIAHNEHYTVFKTYTAEFGYNCDFYEYAIGIIYFIHISSLKVYMDQLVNKRKLLSLIYRV